MQNGVYRGRKSNEPFRRVTASKEVLPDKFKNNSFDGVTFFKTFNFTLLEP